MEAFGIMIIVVILVLVIQAMVKSSRGEYHNTVPASPETEYRILTLAVPPATRWEPSAAIGLITMLMKLSSGQQKTIWLRIQAVNSQIRFQIYLDRQLVDQVERAILSFYPQADISGEPARQREVTKPHIEVKYRSVIPHFAPFAYADESDSVDPLTGIVAALAHLDQDERAVYTIALGGSVNVGYDWKKNGMIMIHKSSAPLLLEALALSASNKKVIVTSPRSLDKYEKPQQSLFEEKLGKFMITVFPTIYVEAASTERCQDILQNVENALGVFDRPNSNMLVPLSPKTEALGLCPQEAAAFWHLPSEQIKTPGVVWSSGAKAPLPVELMQQDVGILLGHNTYQGKTLPVYLDDKDRITHMNIIGKTRVGKTTFMHNLIHQDIADGMGVGVIDPHGDLVRAILASSIPPEREQDVVLFDLADVQHPVPLNLFYVPPGVPKHAAVELTLGVLKKMFAEQWSATRMEDALYSALTILSDVPGATLRDMPKLFLDEEYRNEVLAQTNNSVALEYWLDDYGRMSEHYQLEVARPIMHRIRAFYRNPVIEQIVVQPTSLDFRALMDEGKIFLASLAGEATQAESATIGALLISKLQMAAMSRSSLQAEGRRMYYLYIDEVQNFVTTSLSTMFSEAAKYGLSLTVANQYLRQLEGGTLEAIIGNTGTTVMFACGADDAQDLGRYVKPSFDGQTLMNLDRFQTIVKMQSNGKTLPAFSMQTPPPLAKPEGAVERAARIRGRALAQYARKEEKQATAEQTAAEASSSGRKANATDGEIPSLQL